MKECHSLEEVRDEIDKIDDKIIELIAARKDYVKQAAKFKHSIDEIKSDERIEDVINRVRHQALTLGLSPNMVTEIYTKMINDMVETEIAQFRNAKNF
ncbi:MAG: chorismate mutase, partial [Campylobacteraceae bacterium 4484_4]